MTLGYLRWPVLLLLTACLFIDEFTAAASSKPAQHDLQTLMHHRMHTTHEFGGHGEAVRQKYELPGGSINSCLKWVHMQGWLFPILRYGPNNQIRDFKRLIALAKHLDRGIILTGVFRHHLDEPQYRGKGTCFPGHGGRFVPMERLIDRASLSQWLPVANVTELKQTEGWDGTLSALVHAKDVLQTQSFHINRTCRVMGVTLSPSHTSLLHTKDSLVCRKKMVEQLRQATQQHRYLGVVLVQLGNGERPDKAVGISTAAVHDAGDLQYLRRCQDTVQQAMQVLQPSSWLTSLARRYSQQYMTVANQRYLAVHIRPFPDSCLDEWKSGRLQPSVMLPLGVCIPELRRLHGWFGGCVSSLATRHNLSSVLVVCHPAIRGTVTQLLAQVGLVPQYVDSDAVEALAKCRDGGSSFLVMVEQQLAAQATVFLGTGRSSITQNIAYQRLGSGKQNHFLEQGECRRWRQH